MSISVEKGRVTSSTLLAITLVFFQFLRFVTTSCDTGCICQQLVNGSHVICPHLNSSSMFPEDVFRLEIENNTFLNDAITNVALPALQNLRHLAIRKCGITNITRLAFVRLELLQDLILSYNLISEISLGSFDGLSCVRRIFLNSNRLGHLPDGLFRELDLNFLDLSDNLFAAIPGNSFSGSSVRSLNLDLNHIAFAVESNFHWLRTSLRELTISYNRCVLRLHNSSISQLNLSRLHVTSSQINDTSFLINSSLVEVDISGNVPSADLFWSSLRLSKTDTLYARNLRLTSLPVGSLASLSSAGVLDLSENLISVVRAENFIANRQLRHLNLAHNSIGRLGKDFGRNLRNLETLNLSRNALRFLYDESLAEMIRLKILDLSENQFQFISEPMFQLASVITRIDGNPLHCNCQLLWLRSWLLRQEVTTSPAVTCASPFAGPIVSTRDDQFNCSSPSIVPLPTTVNVTEGSGLDLTCSATADPLASVSWTNDKDSTLMSVTPSVTQDRSVTKMSARLGMKRLSLWNAGTYVCRASNVVGSTSASLIVNVLQKVTASDAVTSSVERQSLVTTSETLRDTMTSSDSLSTALISFLGTQSTMDELSQIDLTEPRKTSPASSETTEFTSTNPNPQRPTIAPTDKFTTEMESSRDTTEKNNQKHTEGFTNFMSLNLSVYVSSASATDTKVLLQANFSKSSDVGDSATSGETWESSTEKDLANDSTGNKGEAKLSPFSFHGLDLTDGMPVVGTLLAFAGLVVLSGIGIFCWSKHRRRGEYKVTPLPRGLADMLDLRICGNAEVGRSYIESATASDSSDPLVTQTIRTAI